MSPSFACVRMGLGFTASGHVQVCTKKASGVQGQGLRILLQCFARVCESISALN